MVRRLQLPSEPASAERAVRFAEAIGLQEALPAETVDRLVLAMGEAITNAIRHGNASDPRLQVTIRWVSEGEGGWLEVEDEGPGFDPQRLVEAALPDDPTQTNGRGLFLMRALSDAFEVKGSRLRLRFAPRPDEAW